MLTAIHLSIKSMSRITHYFLYQQSAEIVMTFTNEPFLAKLQVLISNGLSDS